MIKSISINFLELLRKARFYEAGFLILFQIKPNS